ncbi:phospholipase D family protein [Pseudomonas sp. CCI1.2]|uniref:phospholipase D family protein n=1 Tax=Pseudomonas sp. CCI1.2 TaxID=3048614 RepID=UPI002B22EBA3|nr:phospholipase D family protein [Pseudomonas sp. CCI1.2]MEB0122232.1 phospholipase D family protein [Pseudomonas sp. CCI1.2]
MSTRICIQDPYFSNSYSLHEALNLAGSGATYAAGAYAFVSKGGVELLMGTPSFEAMLGQRPIHLIIGMDAITNEAAVTALAVLQERYENLQVQAFLHDQKGSVFHPKVCWFRNDGGGVVITGSGNLTVGGLRRNREVFALSYVSEEELLEVEENWRSWLEENGSKLYELDSEEVLERARLNNVIRAVFLDDLEGLEVVGTKQLQEVAVIEAAEEVDAVEDKAEWLFDIDSPFLVAQIPRSGKRWKQANFALSTFVNFFGGIRGDNSCRLVIRAIYDSGELGGLEDRPCVTVSSDNFRVELAAASGLAYPEDGRPIGVFVRVSVRMFVYYISMPGAPAHDFLEHWLYENSTGPGNQMKRVVATMVEAPQVIENLPLINFLRV